MHWPARIAEAILWASCALAVILAFVWPFLVSPDPASTMYRALALVALLGMFCAILWLVVRKLLATAQRR